MTMLNRDELAGKFGISQTVISKYLKQGLPNTRKGKNIFFGDDAIQWIEQNSYKFMTEIEDEDPDEEDPIPFMKIPGEGPSKFLLLCLDNDYVRDGEIVLSEKGHESILRFAKALQEDLDNGESNS
ncbi:MAG: hypothetical protein E3K32_11870 [wastewater metagenome]|nr:hypothetical protein [Candidatus Loosdrechtia aerotolerans]